jgi:hypothetical protein
MDTLPNLDLATRFGRVRCFVNIGEHGKSYSRNFWRVGRLYLKSRLAFRLEFTIEEWKLKSWGFVQPWAD